MKYVYETTGVCPIEIELMIDNEIIQDIEFLGGGCDGNLKALKKLIIGMTTKQVKDTFSGITCGGKETSCMDQLSKAVDMAIVKS